MNERRSTFPKAAPATAARVASLARRWPLVGGMLAAIALVTSLAWWDAQRESEAALRDAGTEQTVLATSLAANLRARLAREPGDGRTAAADAMVAARSIERPAELVVLVAEPFETMFHATDGRLVSSGAVRNAVDSGAASARLARPEAAELGLPARTAMAGIARVDAGSLGHWSVVTVASAARQRDREARAFRRLVLGVVVASSLVLAFGGVALRKQRAELELARELAVAQVQRERDEQLLRAARVATMGTFAMGIAHEVATPLGVIIGRAEQLLARAGGDERATRSTQAILTEADHIQTIIRRFLDQARGGPPVLEHADPAVVARAALASVEHRFAEAGVSVAVDASKQMPAIQCDRALLEHALVNLLLNACEACSRGGHVEVATRADADKITFVVTDDGAGISPEHAARVAEPFFTTKPAGRGTGLGLAIATEIAKSHRGDLTIGPNTPRGTSACIEVPVATAGGAHA
jgi:signal transduction histidine kinase